MEHRDRHANVALDLNNMLETHGGSNEEGGADWMEGDRTGGGQLEFKAYRKRGTEGARWRRDQRGRRRRQRRAKLLIRYHLVSWKLHF